MLAFQVVIYFSKLTYFGLRKPRIRAFYTASSQSLDFMDKHYLVFMDSVSVGLSSGGDLDVVDV